MSVSLTAATTATQWGVGHGGFHTQKTIFTDPRGDVALRFVYDCGSSSAPTNVEPWVTSYVSGLVSEKASHIDLLVISHFDFDHVGGLPELAKQLKAKSIKVRRVVAPAITRLDALLLYANVKPATGATLWYRRLLMNPSDELEEQFPQAIVSLLTNTQNGEDLEADARVRFTEPPADIEQSAVGAGRLTVTTSASGGVEVTTINKTKIWELIPYAIPSAEAGREGLLKKLEEEFDIDLIALGYDDLFNTLCEDKGRLREVRKLAAAQLGARRVNANSVSLWAGPAIDTAGCGRGEVSLPSGSIGQDTVRTIHCSVRSVAWLGTGDAELNTATRVGDLTKHFTQPRMKSVLVASAPHHGSHHNSCAELWDQFDRGTVVTLHAQGRYRLPSNVVVAAISEAGQLAVRVNQVTGTLQLRSWHEFCGI